MTADQKLHAALESTDLSEDQKNTVFFALGFLSVLNEPLIAIAEAKQNIPYRKLAAELGGLKPGRS